MEVTLLGTGDTTGTPTVGCDCDTCREARDPGEDTRRQLRERGRDPDTGVDRTRFSVHVRNERTDESLLLDVSPDFRQQFLTHDVALPDAVVVSHVHFDHLDGLGNANRLFDHLPVHAANVVDDVTGESVAETVARKFDYLDALDVRAEVPHEPFGTCGFEVTLVPVTHPPMDCYGAAVVDPETGAKLSLSGDTAYHIPAESSEVLADPDLLLADGLVPAHLSDYHPQGGADHDGEGVPRTFGTKHMTREGALAMGEALDADETRVVHVSHFYPADEAFAEPLAIDGERYRL